MVCLGRVDKRGFYNCSMGHGQFRYVMNGANMFYIYVHAPCLHASILRFLSTLFKKMFSYVLGLCQQKQPSSSSTRGSLQL